MTASNDDRPTLPRAPTPAPAGPAKTVGAPPCVFLPDQLVAGRYLIVRFLARGGMGEVYEAVDLELKETVALKTVSADSVADEPSRARFLREIQLARKVTHPNVCRIFDIGFHRPESPSTDGAETVFLTMQLLCGETLAERLESGGPMTTTAALPFIQQMASALNAAHEAGVIHRDFKTRNVVLVNSSGGERAIVVDFGLARNSDTGDSLDLLGPAFGSPDYMAPEQIMGETTGPRSDIYALGVVLYEMMSGKLPFIADSPLAAATRRLTHDPAPLRSLTPDVDPRWEEVILRCLARNPDERFADALAVVTALDPTTAHVPQPARHSLPAERDSFVGRGMDLADLDQRLGQGARLVTVVGTAGTGKTRLVQHYGWASLQDWPGGVWFADLTQARDLVGIAYAVASALEVPLGSGDLVVQLGHAIAGRGRSLLILDNFEHLVMHAEATVGRWLASAPETTFIVTSRERLQLTGEEVMALEPLDVETAGVELLVLRARAQKTDFAISPDNADDILAIVRLLDGLPLAIELAAARIRILSPRQLRERLGDRFQLLTSGRASHSRQSTLKTAIDWSWDLLQSWEQLALAQASIFVAGFRLEAAESVLDLSSSPGAPPVMDVVQSLLDKSLLRTWTPASPGKGATSEPWFGMYETIHEYATEKLRTWSLPTGAGNTSAETAISERHGRYYARFGTEEAIDALDRHGGLARHHELALELDNLIAACHRAVDRGDGATAVATLVAAASVIELKGPFEVAAELARRVLELPHQEPQHRRRAGYMLASALSRAGRMVEALKHFEDALAIARKAGNGHITGDVLRRLAGLHHNQGRMEEALQTLREALGLAQESGHHGLAGTVLGSLGLLHHRQGRMEEALRDYQAALAIHRELGNCRLESIVLGNLGILHTEQGRLEEALKHYVRALGLARELGNRTFEGVVLANLGSLYHEQGLVAEALRHYQEALAIHREVGARNHEGHVRGNLGSLLQEQGLDEAMHHFEAALAIHCEIGARSHEGHVRQCLGRLNQQNGRLEVALGYLQEALAIYREVGDRRGEGAILGSLGLLRAGQGRFDEARASLAVGETLLRDVNERFELGTLLCRRGECERLAGDLATAREHKSRAEAIAQELTAGAESELGKELAKLRAALDGAATDC